MSPIQFLLDVFQTYSDQPALIWNNHSYNYNWLMSAVKTWQSQLKKWRISPGTVVALESDFSPNAVALLLALIDRPVIMVPLTTTVQDKKNEYLSVAQVEAVITLQKNDQVTYKNRKQQVDHRLYTQLRTLHHPGLVLFSSGSTGTSKATVHDFCNLLDKFTTPRHSLRVLAFLLFDHIGGLNTLLYSLANGGCLVTVPNREPQTVLTAIDQHQVELLPTSPTFLNLMLLSETYHRFSLKSLKIISYGTEPMLESTLKRLHALFPHVRLLQTYGLSEVGILRSQSKDSDSLWMRIGGEGYQTRVVDGILHIKTRSAMLGYLNAPSPFTEDGWFNTQDLVEVDGDYFKIKGRQSEMINVGGQKVYPAEVESVIQELPEVREVTIYGEKNPLIGAMVCAKITSTNAMPPSELSALVRKYCHQKLEKYKVPIKIEITDQVQYTARFKKRRNI